MLLAGLDHLEGKLAMKLADFRLGTEFSSCTGQRWRCTDVGSRTIVAIELKPELDECWFAGPPYVVEEVVFDESEIARVYRDTEEDIRETVGAATNSAHPGFPHEAVTAMSDAWFEGEAQAYPRKRLWEVERVDEAGEILHPYSSERDGDGWRILLYQPFTQRFTSLPEHQFIRLRPATAEDLRQRRLRAKD